MSTINRGFQSNAFSMGEFVWFLGVVEDRMDPEKVGRLKVRIYGYHSENKQDISTEDLMWAPVVEPVSSAFFGGIGVSPTGIVEGTTVLGFFLDGHNGQNPVILGTLGGKPQKASGDEGFNDPNGIYTRYESGEADTNRLARNENLDKTNVQWRKDKTEKQVDKAFGGNWEEPETPYDAKYPFNHVRETEPKPQEDVSGSQPPENGGHIEEFDDTPGAERYYLQHKKGTFTEIHPDGTEVHKVIKNRYVIIEEDEHLYVKGNRHRNYRWN